MSYSSTSRRQRTASTAAFSSCAVSAVRSNHKHIHRGSSFVQSTCRSFHSRDGNRETILMVVAPPRKVAHPRNISRFSQPVPEAKPHEIFPPRRGRNSRRRSREAEHFRKYMYLRRQLKPWSDNFKNKFGRIPTMIDVCDSDVPGLFDRFVEYREALEGLRIEV